METRLIFCILIVGFIGWLLIYLSSTGYKKKRTFKKSYPVGMLGIVKVSKWEDGFLFGNFYNPDREYTEVALDYEIFEGKIFSFLAKITRNNGRAIQIEACEDPLEVKILSIEGYGYRGCVNASGETFDVRLTMEHIVGIMVGSIVIAKQHPFWSNGYTYFNFKFLRKAVEY